MTTLPASIADAELISCERETNQTFKLCRKSFGSESLGHLVRAMSLRKFPSWSKLHKEFRSKGLEVVGLSTEDPEFSTEKVRNFVADFEMILSCRLGHQRR